MGEARRMTEKSCHGVAGAVGVLKALAEHHVATAFAVHRARSGKLRKPRAKARRSRKRARVKLRIAAGQPAAIAALRWRLVRERREGDGESIAALTRNEAAYISSGAAAGLTLATAACIATRWPGGASGGVFVAAESVNCAALAIIASRSRWRSAMSAR